MGLAARTLGCGAVTPAGTEGRAGGSALPPGRLVADRYEIVGSLGAGGTGVVYAARDLALGVDVALKTLSPGLISDGVSLERFRREIQSARRITHSNVCRIFDLGIEREGSTQLFFFTMELLPGQSLAQGLEGGRTFTIEETLPVAVQLADGLQAAHDQGIVHRDLKPANIMLSPLPAGARWPFRVTITDFGIALSDDQAAARLTLSQEIIGTPDYMAPEQVEPGPIGPAADVYALGLILYEMLAGRGAFDAGATPLATVLRRKQEAPRSLRLAVPNVDSVWEGTINRCLERDPARRFARVADVGRVLLGELGLPKRGRR
jgi:serine/threonine protein kinase